MPIALTYDEVKALDPCSDAFSRAARLLGGKKGWSGNRIDAAAAREAGITFDDLVWVAFGLARKDTDVKRRMGLWMADCAARVLHIYEKSVTSEAPRTVIIVARQFARGEIDAAALDAARAAASAAAKAAARATAWAAARAAAKAAASASSSPAAVPAARAAASAAASAAEWDAGVPAARAAEKDWQFDRLVCRLSDDEPDDWPLPAISRKVRFRLIGGGNG